MNGAQAPLQDDVRVLDAVMAVHARLARSIVIPAQAGTQARCTGRPRQGPCSRGCNAGTNRPNG
jgi:hypothetical protein